jgi:thiamine-monophosphate kinase
MKEFQLIEKFFKPLTDGREEARNLGDDVAKISLKKGEELVVSKDLMVENVHFLLADGGFKIASKLLRSNLSDLASAGATPIHYLLGFSKNENTDQKFIKEFARGLKSVQNEFGLYLIGGDTVKSEKLFFSITIFGRVKKGKILARNQAREGDLIFVSGTIGDAFLGLKGFSSLNKGLDQFLKNRHFFPTPRIELGKKLLEKNLSKCAIDVSDGLLSDLQHLCRASELEAEIHLNQIPISEAAQKILAKNSEVKILDLLSGGDDYELIFATNPKNLQKIAQLSRLLNLKISCIGQFKKSVAENFSINLRDEKNRKIKIEKFGYEH